MRRQAAETIEAMAEGVDVVFQATFFDGRWLGYADFLLRVESPDRPSVWGPYHYEVADTKLARHVKAGAVLQICSYVEQLTRIQGVQPEQMQVVLGGSARETATLRVDDYMAYFRAAKRRFELAVLGTDVAPAPPAGLPTGRHLPGAGRALRRLPLGRALPSSGDATTTTSRSSPASPPANARRSSPARSTRWSASRPRRSRSTRLSMGRAPPASSASASRLASRSRVAGCRSRSTSCCSRRRASRSSRSAASPLLPEPNAGDLFLDLEGDPYALDDGVDYLFGVLDVDGAFTAHLVVRPERPVGRHARRREGARSSGSWICSIERLERFPKMHVYHYAPYEPTALKRLMGRHATREDEVDRLLRGGVLVDLFRAVRQGLRASVESYSIKRIEPLYDFVRDIPLRDAGSSIVAFEEWLQLGDGDRPASDILDAIAAYNRDDVRSTLRLRDWLEGLRRSSSPKRSGTAVPRPAEVSQEAPVSTAASDARVQEIGDALTARRAR